MSDSLFSREGLGNLDVDAMSGMDLSDVFGAEDDEGGGEGGDEGLSTEIDQDLAAIDAETSAAMGGAFGGHGSLYGNYGSMGPIYGTDPAAAPAGAGAWAVDVARATDAFLKPLSAIGIPVGSWVATLGIDRLNPEHDEAEDLSNRLQDVINALGWVPNDPAQQAQVVSAAIQHAIAGFENTVTDDNAKATLQMITQGQGPWYAKLMQAAKQGWVNLFGVYKDLLTEVLPSLSPLPLGSAQFFNSLAFFYWIAEKAGHGVSADIADSLVASGAVGPGAGAMAPVQPRVPSAPVTWGEPGVVAPEAGIGWLPRPATILGLGYALVAGGAAFNIWK